MGLGLISFLALWLAMMAAMMSPSVYPTVRLFDIARRSRLVLGERPAPTWAFVAGYLAMWSLVGLPAYALLAALPRGMFESRLKGLALLIGGVYQLTPWKRACLGYCCPSLELLGQAWREGRAGAFAIGARNGAYCVGCCWGLMLVLLALGMMDPAWMVAVAAVVFVEKVVPRGAAVGRALGAVLVVFGVALALGVRAR